MKRLRLSTYLLYLVNIKYYPINTTLEYCLILTGCSLFLHGVDIKDLVLFSPSFTKINVTRESPPIGSYQASILSNNLINYCISNPVAKNKT